MTIRAVLARGESDMASTAVAIPDCEAQELETSQRAFDEMELRISKFGGRLVVVAQESLTITVSGAVSRIAICLLS